jgi:hypothetical protein
MPTSGYFRKFIHPLNVLLFSQTQIQISVQKKVVRGAVVTAVAVGQGAAVVLHRGEEEQWGGLHWQDTQHTAQQGIKHLP